MIGRVNSCQEYFDTLSERFIADKANGVTATYVYELDGDGGGTWTVRVTDGNLSVDNGAAPDANVTYKMAADNYVKLVNGDLSGAKAVLTRKLKVSGSIPLAKKMNDFLPPLKS